MLPFEGRTYPVMLLSYLPGHVLGEADLSRGRLAALWARCSRDSAWRCAASFTAHRPEGDSSGTRSMPATWRTMSRVFSRKTGRWRARSCPRTGCVTVPKLAQLRSQIIHGDIHPYNTLMADDATITGIIDFGDLVHAPLVQDLSNAVSDFLFPGRDHAATIFEMVRGYCQRHAAGGGGDRRAPRHDRGAPADDATGRQPQGEHGHFSAGLFRTVQQPHHSADPRAEGHRPRPPACD